MKKSGVWMLLAGLVLGLVIGSLFTFGIMNSGRKQQGTVSGGENKMEQEQVPDTEGEVRESTAEEEIGAGMAADLPEWDAESVYTGGDEVVYENRIYRAKWWTQGEIPGKADVWEDTLTSPAGTDAKEDAKKPEDMAPPEAEPADRSTASEGFKVVGYYPSWKPEDTDKIDYDILTHVIYAFAIPTAEGGLRPLENPEAAQAIIADAHKAGRKVLLAVGGWSYNDVPLEATFVSATETEKKRAGFVEAMVAMCEEYGFDGIDMDWEHPRVDGASAGQYEALMLDLAEELHKRGKVLTSAVLSGVTPDGNIYYDAAAHSDKVLNAVDWIHVMAYDGGDGERHSTYEFAVSAAEYWRDTRGVPAEKVVLGMPFYARPSWASYSDILAADGEAYKSDVIEYNGMEVWYNGIGTIQKKTRYAMEGLGGVMIWELTMDTSNREKSLLAAIGEVVR